ncbi:MAG: valine--tRNA ligase [Candidatus Korobacteraceae bacterium]|jgi:valyl-tRNA synthetase
MPHDLPKAYDPGAIEPRWAEYWVREKLFHVETPAAGSTQETFTITLPPPNVTGNLHMGHMLEHTEIDIVVRWKRMSGLPTLWLPGTDHAGIATQLMVERQLASEGKNRRDIGREAFIARVWDWKQHYGGVILQQMKRLGASVDWSREYFTMDERMSRAVREAFVRLYDEGLIYRGKYIVNWCPRCITAVSDLEVVHEDTSGKIWEIRYPVIGSPAKAESQSKAEYIVVATTRPETMLGDTAVAVNSADDRYRHLHGKRILLPLINREIPIITDDILANPEFGTGAVKVTPSHDPNDFETGLRNNLPQIEVINEVAQMNQNAGPYQGLDRFEARQKVLEDLERGGFLVGSKDYVVPLGKCGRCKTIIEPRLSTQWFVKIKPLAQRAIEVVECGDIKFVPENYTKTYFEWMRNIYDWCISRQLWWGHRIPAWYCKACGEIIVAREAPSKCTKCGGPVEQDSDVLDTWFSSGLLPCSALGWPDSTPDLDAFYPTTLLITGFDILFFWVARMIMLNCHFMRGDKHGDVPFRTVHIHGLVRDAERQKMSKTKGNVMDPIEIIEKYGTDAVRFTMAAMVAPGGDIAFSESRTESYRAFANKIWNAARFLFMNVDKAQQAGLWSLAEFTGAQNWASTTMSDSSTTMSDTGAVGGKAPISHNVAGVLGFRAETLEDRWILSRFNRVAREINAALETYRFHEAAHVVYHFFWGEYCDWYLELIKPRLTADNRDQARTAYENLISIFEGALRLLSPFMPFITEELWHAVYDGQPPAKSIALAAYPKADPAQIEADAETGMAILQDLIVSVRNIRAELKVEPKQKLAIELHAGSDVRSLIESNRNAVERLANVAAITFVEESLAKASGARSTARFDVRVLFERKLDVAAERDRLSKELAKLTQELTRAMGQLNNEAFLSKAPAHVIEGLKKRKAEVEVLVRKANDALGELGA